MEGVHTLKEILKLGDWLAKVDLKDSFFTIPIHVAQSKYLQFQLDKLKKICAESHKLAREQTTSAHSLAWLLGKVNATTPVIPPAPLFCRHLQMSLTRAPEEGSQSYETPVTLSTEGRE